MLLASTNIIVNTVGRSLLSYEFLMSCLCSNSFPAASTTRWLPLPWPKRASRVVAAGAAAGALAAVLCWQGNGEGGTMEKRRSDGAAADGQYGV